MPEMDGIRMAGEIQKIKADTRFIMISAYSQERYRQELTELGVLDSGKADTVSEIFCRRRTVHWGNCTRPHCRD